MEQSFQTSFIPKKPLATERFIERRPISILSFLSIVSIVGVCLAFGGVFLYKNLLIKQKAESVNSLRISRQSFEPETISELELFNKRTSASKQVLSGHRVLSPFFMALGKLTIPSIQFTKFEQRFDEKGFSVKMAGLARDYTSIALQAQVFNGKESQYFKDVVFSNLVLIDSKEKKGYVSFDVSFSVDPSLLSYENNALINITPFKESNSPVQLKTN